MPLVRSSAIGMFLCAVALLAVAMTGSARAELITPHAATPETVTPHEVTPVPAPELAPASESEYAGPAPEAVAPSAAAGQSAEDESAATADAGAGRKNGNGDGRLREASNDRPQTSPHDPSCDYNCLGDWIVYGRGVVDQAGNPFATASIPIETRVSIFFRRLELELAVQQLEEELRSKWARRPPPPASTPPPTAGSDSADAGDGNSEGDSACRNGNGDEAEEQIEDGGSGSVACR
jgi:hypothetical protein